MSNQDLAEYLIRKAKAEGLLEDYKGARTHIPPTAESNAFLKAGYRIMAEAGALPREISLKKAIAEQYETLHEAKSDEEREEAFRKLADLQMVLGIEQDARRKFYMD